jgi:site-specific recombinase XerD
MAEIDDHIATYLQAIEIEGKSVKTIASYANTLADFRTIGRRLGFPDSPVEYRVTHVYAFLSELRSRGASAAYQHRRHREVKACFSWLRRMDVIEQNVFAGSHSSGSRS